MDFIKNEESKQLYRKYYSQAENLYYGQIRATRFLDPYEKELVISIMNSFELFYHVFRSHKNVERTVIFFSENDFDFDSIFHENLSVLYYSRDNHGLNHRDVLGALMSLGIERDLIGDILIDDNLVEISCLKEISDYIRFNLDSIKNLNLRLKEKDSIYMDDTIIKFEEKQASISSLRLDNFVAVAINTSRSKAQKLIKKEFVKLNYLVEVDDAKEIKVDDVISIRGHGRYFYQEFISKTKKDKDRILIRKIL